MKTVLEPEHAEAHAQEASQVALFSNWVQQGTENFFAAQRILLDLVMRQNTIAMDALRERLASTSPGTAFLKEASGFANFVAAQKILFELAQRQNNSVMTGVKERVGESTATGGMVGLLRRSVETFIDLQQHFLDTAATGDAFGKGLGESARESLERHCVDAFNEAQKKLLDTTGNQLEISVKAANKAAAALAPSSDTSLSELTRGGLEDFVAAQKALLDLMVKLERGG